MEPANLPSAEPLIGLVNAPTQPEGKTVALNADATIRCEAPEIQICETPFNAKAVACSTETQETALDSVQLSFCDKVLKNAKRLKDAPPFLHPVDPVLLGIPNYVDVIKCPMDLSTIQRRLSTCFYKRQTEFMNDLSLMFSNCYLFNGRDSLIGHMAQKLEHYFQNQMKGLPTRTEGYPSLSRKKLSAIHATPDSKPRIRGAAIASPKKAATPKRIRKPPPVSERAVFRFATTLLRELKTKHYSISYPFLAPVDPIRLGIPYVPTCDKKPNGLWNDVAKIGFGAVCNASRL
ncbi:Bromodomain-containing protein [Zopfochytrium polystomum]|nr:Bromodomain-containing protein [Zopfochytrium polystomum]